MSDDDQEKEGLLDKLKKGLPNELEISSSTKEPVKVSVKWTRKKTPKPRQRPRKSKLQLALERMEREQQLKNIKDPEVRRLLKRLNA